MITVNTGIPIPTAHDTTTDTGVISVREKEHRLKNLHDARQLGFVLDSDVYENGNVVYLNRHNYITNSNFETPEQVESFLRLWGKIPSFITIKESPGKGWGAFTTFDIDTDVILGFYEGMKQPHHSLTNCYHYSIKGFDIEDVGVVDAENMRFSDWTRFMNHSDDCNVTSVCINYEILLHTNRVIKAGEELTIDYGPEYKFF